MYHFRTSKIFDQRPKITNEPFLLTFALPSWMDLRVILLTAQQPRVSTVLIRLQEAGRWSCLSAKSPKHKHRLKRWLPPLYPQGDPLIQSAWIPSLQSYLIKFKHSGGDSNKAEIWFIIAQIPWAFHLRCVGIIKEYCPDSFNYFNCV